ncbi:MAG TPA: outer membrane lipoprotein-sorting protein [Acidobacteriota bacterium]|nr:outer membrane lipoprotein-sorting protein [Acidobacteriota bacterium]
MSSRLGLAIVLCGLMVLPARADSNEGVSDSADQIVRKIDQLYRSQSSYARMEMEIITPRWQRTLTMDIWTADMDKTFIRITSPKKERGVASLRIGNEMWNFLPKTNKVLKIPPSMMMSSWMGSDFTNDDLVKEYSLFEDYAYEFTTVDEPRDDLYYINCIPREDLPVVWANIVIAARTTDFLPVWMKYYDEKGELIRVWEYSDVRIFDGRRIPATMVLIPQHQEGHKTVLHYIEARFDTPLDENTFTLQNLRSQQ